MDFENRCGVTSRVSHPPVKLNATRQRDDGWLALALRRNLFVVKNGRGEDLSPHRGVWPPLVVAGELPFGNKFHFISIRLIIITITKQRYSIGIGSNENKSGINQTHCHSICVDFVGRLVFA